MLQQAIQAYQSENYASADLILKRVIQVDSKNLPALHILGLIKASQKNYKEAADLLLRAGRICPDDASIQYNLAKALSDSGRNQEAVAHHKKAVALSPSNPEAWLNYGKTASSLGRYGDALTYYDKALSLKTDYAEAALNKGATLKELGRFEEAVELAELALNINPNLAEAWSNKGVALKEIKRYEEAIAHYDRALSLRPEYCDAWVNKGVALQVLKHYNEAIAQYDQALTLNPDHHEAWSNKGVSLQELRRYKEALIHFDRAISLKPNYYEALTNKAVALQELKHFDEAFVYYDKALSINPEYHEASWNKGLLLLLQGDFENGLPLYESRWKSDKRSISAGKRIFDRPTWLGIESLKGKTILVYGEQGFGDCIQFCRYVQLLSDLGASVVLEVPRPLASLMASLRGVTQIVVQGDELPMFDYQCPLLSLPLALKTTLLSIPWDGPYLAADVKKVSDWKLKLGETKKIRVGLAWSSTSLFEGDANRSLKLAEFVKSLPDDGFEYVCLQKELKECDKDFFTSYKNILFLGDELNDFSDTAALIECLDLVVSTCTSIPHLSGSLGKKTWILLSYLADWRWLTDRDDSPWYPSVCLYRQASMGGWDSVLERVKLDLEVLR